jgi:hypothetical protein
VLACSYSPVDSLLYLPKTSEVLYVPSLSFMCGVLASPESESSLLRLPLRLGCTPVGALRGVAGTAELGEVGNGNSNFGESGGVHISIRSGDGDTDIDLSDVGSEVVPHHLPGTFPPNSATVDQISRSDQTLSNHVI